MWNSNSVIAWLIARTGLDAEAIQPPTGGRAPGWNAGLVVARRQQLHAPREPQRPRRPISQARELAQAKKGDEHERNDHPLHTGRPA
jgi:hypothetical protein